MYKFKAVGEFIESLNLPNVSIAIISTKDDCKTFFSDFYMKNPYIIDDVLDFREFKIAKSKKTADIFVNECNTNGMKATFEETFMQSFTDESINLVRDALDSGKTSLDIIFRKFKINPNENILKNIL